MAFRELVVVDDPGAEVARRLEAAIRESVAAGGHAAVGLSGGSAPSQILPSLSADLPWADVDLFQVDERVAPDGDADRNLRAILEHLPSPARDRVHPMPVTEEPLADAAARYASSLPPRFDVVQLGIGPDGHTASLVPGDPVLEVADRDVTVTGSPYQGRLRMTLTFPALARAGLALWIAIGGDKAPALRRLLADDERIPASRVAAPRQVVVADRAAASFPRNGA